MLGPSTGVRIVRFTDARYPLSMELSIPLSKKNEPLFRQVYKGLRKAILSGAFPASCPPPAISPSNWVFPGQRRFWRMTNCPPKVSRLAVSDLERMSP
jgi:hypothetical protein